MPSVPLLLSAKLSTTLSCCLNMAISLLPLKSKGTLTSIIFEVLDIGDVTPSTSFIMPISRYSRVALSGAFSLIFCASSESSVSSFFSTVMVIFTLEAAGFSFLSSSTSSPRPFTFTFGVPSPITSTLWLASGSIGSGSSTFVHLAYSVVSAATVSVSKSQALVHSASLYQPPKV